MADENLVARFARTIRDLLVPPPFVPDFDEHPDPLIARLEWAIACLPERTRDVFLTRHVERSCFGGRPGKGQGLPSRASSCSDALGARLGEGRAILLPLRGSLPDGT